METTTLTTATKTQLDEGERAMAISKIERREFRFGVKALPDLNPSISADEALQLHAHDHPELINSKLEGPVIVDGVQVYTVKTSLGYKG